MSDEARSRRVLPPWAWPALDQLDKRMSALDEATEHLLVASARQQEQLDALAATLAQVHEWVGAIHHRSVLIEETTHLARHLTVDFELVRDDVETISELSLTLQRLVEDLRPRAQPLVSPAEDTEAAEAAKQATGPAAGPAPEGSQAPPGRAGR